jgi:hypothetical protein
MKALPSTEQKLCYVLQTSTRARVQIAHGMHKNALPDEWDVILNATGLQWDTVTHVPVDVGQGTTGESCLKMLNDVDLNVSLKHCVFAEALSKRFSSLMSSHQVSLSARNSRSTTQMIHASPFERVSIKDSQNSVM